MLERYEWLPVAYVFTVFFGTALMIGLMIIAWRWRQRSVAGQMFFGMTVALTAWMVAGVLQFLSDDYETILFWDHLRYLGVAFAPLSAWLFALAYVGQERWLRRPWLIAFAAIPTVTQFVYLFMPEWFLFDLVYQSLLGFSFHVSNQKGFWYQIHTFYSYGLILGAIGLLGYASLTQPYPYNRQVLVMILGMVLPMLVNIYTLFFPTTLPPWDLTALTFLVTIVVWAWALYRYRLFDLMPVARSEIIEAMQDAVVVMDGQGRIVDVNAQAAYLIGQEKGVLVGKLLRQFMTNVPHLIEQFSTADQAEAEIVVNERTYEMRIATVKSGRYQNGRYILLRDITARKEVEAERERLISELDAYAHTVAHDLKNPVANLIGNADFLQELHEEGEFDGPDVVDSLQAVSVVGHKMTNIINELLLLASVRDQSEIPHDPLAMRSIVEQALARLEPQLTEVTVAWQWDERETAVGYAPWVEEVWVNYLSNGIKYGGNPPHLLIGVDVLADGRSRYWVQDNGKGIPPEQQGNLFADFNRLHQHVRAEGHGLGLSIVQRIITRLDGEVGVESDGGTGACFYFILPK